MEDKDKSGKTPLLLASELGHKSIVDMLILKGANTSARDGDGNGMDQYLFDNDMI